MAIFVLNTSAAMATSICECPDMPSNELTIDMPCHDVNTAKNTQGEKEQKTSQCKKCSCGNCKVPSHASLIYSPAPSENIASNMGHILCADIFASNIYLSIDNPPKQIS